MNKRISTIIFIILVVLLCVPVLTSMLYKFGVNKFYKASLDVKYKANLEYIKNQNADLEINLSENNDFTNFLINDGYIKIKENKVSFTLKNYYLSKCAYKLEDSDEIIVISLTDNCNINLINNNINNNFTFDSKTQTITDYNGSSDVIIPNKIDGIDVINIGKRAFHNKGITSVYINSSVKTIGEEAFLNNNITKVTIKGNPVIKEKAFMNNFIENIDIESATYGIDSFKNNLLAEEDAYFINDNILVSYGGYSKNITIPSFVEKIEATFNNLKVTTFNTGNNLKEIPDYLFKDNNLKEVIIGENVEKIGKESFMNNKIDNLTILSSKVILGGAFKNNYITTINLPSNLKEIKESAFMNNKIYNITFESKLDYIGEKAFKHNYITSLNLDVTKIDKESFMDNLIETINVNCKEYGIDSFKNNLLNNNDAYFVNGNTLVSYGGYEKNIITIPKIVLRISATFSNLDGWVNLNNTKIIDANVFANNKIKKVNLRNVIEIGENAFLNNDLTSLIVPNSTMFIKEGAFKGNKFNKVIMKGKTSMKDFKEIYFDSFDSGKIVFEGE